MGSRGEAPRGGVPQKLEYFLKYTAWNLRPGENERHNLMPMMAFFIALHTSIVLFQCHVAQCLASWGCGPIAPPPKSALVGLPECGLLYWGLNKQVSVIVAAGKRPGPPYGHCDLNELHKQSNHGRTTVE